MAPKEFLPDDTHNMTPEKVELLESGREKGYYSRVSRGSTVWPIRFREGDIELANLIGEAIGCSPAEAVRTALRAYAVIIDRVIQQGRRGGVE